MNKHLHKWIACRHRTALHFGYKQITEAVHGEEIIVTGCNTAIINTLIIDSFDTVPPHREGSRMCASCVKKSRDPVLPHTIWESADNGAMVRIIRFWYNEYKKDYFVEFQPLHSKRSRDGMIETLAWFYDEFTECKSADKG